MRVTLPYNKEIIANNGAFIKPTGEIIYPTLNMEGFAKSYCEGDYAEILRKMQEGDTSFYLTFQEIASLFNYQGTEIDEYLSSSLTKDELLLLRKWISDHQDKLLYLKDSLYSNFLIQVLRFDKIETLIRRQITTTISNPSTIYWNYLLEDFSIKRVVPKKYNEARQTFEPDITREYLTSLENDALVKRENDEIKRKVLREERGNYYRK